MRVNIGNNIEYSGGKMNTIRLWVLEDETTVTCEFTRNENTEICNTIELTYVNLDGDQSHLNMPISTFNEMIREYVQETKNE